VHGTGDTISSQGGNPAGCSSPLGDPLAAHINMVAVNPTGKGNLQAFPVGAGTGTGLSVNYNTIDTNLANAGTVKTVTASGPDITVASNFSSAHTVIDVLGYYYPDGELLYSAVSPCRIVDTRNTSAGIIGASTQRDFSVHGSSGTISAQGGNPYGCFSPLAEPYAAHINIVAVNPTGKGNLQAFPLGAGAGTGLSVNYNTIDTNLANAGTVKAITGTGPDVTVASNFSSAHTVIDVLGYYYPAGDLLYTPVTPCRIVDTRKTSAGIIDASTQRNFRVFGSAFAISAQGGNPSGCLSPLGEPLAANLNMIAVNPTGKGNLQVFPVGAETGSGLSVNYNTIDTNLANAGTVKTVTGTGADISVASNFSSAHTVIDVLGYYYPAP
jgi:flagellar basal body rod protein FlgC